MISNHEKLFGNSSYLTGRIFHIAMSKMNGVIPCNEGPLILGPVFFSLSLFLSHGGSQTIRGNREMTSIAFLRPSVQYICSLRKFDHRPKCHQKKKKKKKKKKKAYTLVQTTKEMKDVLPDVRNVALSCNYDESVLFF